MLAGEVKVDGVMVTKAGAQVAAGVGIELKEESRYVSRGGLKLERAFEEFKLDVAGEACLDAGASTGGFSDCLLQHGARKVIAVDVGYGQLDWKLRNDARVEVLERTNIRCLEPSMLSEPPAFATFDLSFISLTKVLQAVIACLRPDFRAVALIKPQFEAGRGQVGKGGVVRDASIRRQVLSGIWRFIETSGWTVLGLTASPIRGPKGNIEYLIYFGANPAESAPVPDMDEAIGSLEQESPS